MNRFTLEWHAVPLVSSCPSFGRPAMAVETQGERVRTGLGLRGFPISGGWSILADRVRRAELQTHPSATPAHELVSRLPPFRRRGRRTMKRLLASAMIAGCAMTCAAAQADTTF